jgi:hypothetical protein
MLSSTILAIPPLSTPLKSINMQATNRLPLESLSDGIDVITEDAAGFYKENCMVCFDSQGHSTGVCLNVIDVEEAEKQFTIHWTGKVSNQLRKNYADLQRATDHAACAVALLLVRELTDYNGVEQAAIGTTIDYWLADKEASDDDLIFNHTARLEVSGILRQNDNNSVAKRLHSKLNRLKSGLPAIIIIVEFSRPWSMMNQQ